MRAGLHATSRLHSPIDDALLCALLGQLAEEPDGVSLARLCKRLGVRMSVLLRTLAWIGEDSIDGVPGAGLVQVYTQGERQVARLTAKGRAQVPVVRRSGTSAH